MNPGLSFSIAAIAITQNNLLLVSSRMPGSVNAAVAPEMTLTRTGGASYPAGARAAVSDGALSIVLNERPIWVESLLGEGAEISRLSDNPNESAFLQTNGVTITAAAFVLTAIDASKPIAAGRYEIIAEAGGNIRIIAVTTAGVEDITAALAGQSITIGETNARLTTPTGGVTVGDRAYYSVGAGQGMTDSITFVSAIRRLQEYGLSFLSSDSGDDSAVIEWTLPRCVFNGANIEVEADATSGVRIEGHVLTPLDGRAIVQRRTIYRV